MLHSFMCVSDLKFICVFRVRRYAGNMNTGQTIFSHWISRGDSTQHLGLRQRTSRLANLRHAGPAVDRASTSAVCGRADGAGSGCDNLRTGFHHNRLVPESIPRGPLSAHQECHQTAYTAGPARPHSCIHPYGDGKLHDVHVRDQMPIEAGCFYVLDRGDLTMPASTASTNLAPSS